MKKTLLTLVLLGITLTTTAQNPSVEKSLFGVQAGILGIWGNYETKLTNLIALRGELGLSGSSFTSNERFWAPEITLEPRWYYSIKKRHKKGKSILKNTSNFVSFRTRYRPDIIVIPNSTVTNFINDISYHLLWGIRRHIGSHFNYEAGMAIGYVDYLKDFFEYDDGLSLELHIRIGYSF